MRSSRWIFALSPLLAACAANLNLPAPAVEAAYESTATSVTLRFTASTTDISSLRTLRLVSSEWVVVDGTSTLRLASDANSSSALVTIGNLDSGTDYYFRIDVQGSISEAILARTKSAWKVQSGGTSGANTRTSYGTINVPSADNRVSFSYNPVHTASRGGKFFMFGGVLSSSTGFSINSNVLWSMIDGKWMYLTGTPDLGGDSFLSEMNRGTSGIPSLANSPPALTGYFEHGGSHNACVDENDHFWIYGGATFAWKNQGMLFRYNNAGWAHFHGNSNSATNTPIAPVYGTINVSSTSNTPGSRISTIMHCAKDGKISVFGGMTSNASTGFYNDLHTFDQGTREWTWRGGSTTTNQPGTYGAKGVSSSSNWPGARQDAGNCTDAKGNLWMYGGYGYDASGSLGYLSDLWKFDGTQWTWVAGSNAIEEVPVWGSKNSPAAANTPGARLTRLFCAVDGKLALWGGHRSLAAGSSKYFADAWSYDIAAGQWTWTHGPNSINLTNDLSTAVEGTVGVPDVANLPPAGRIPLWQEPDGSIWVVEHWGSSRLWRYR